MIFIFLISVFLLAPRLTWPFAMLLYFISPIETILFIVIVANYFDGSLKRPWALKYILA